MSKTTHTPGPWIHGTKDDIYLDGDRLIWSSRGAGYGTIAKASQYYAEAVANARLLAAAPDLLAALQGILAVPEALKALANWGDRELIAARAAVARAVAEGKGKP